MHRFYVSPNQISGEEVQFTEDQQRQLRRVLRLRPGDRVAVFDGSGLEYVTELTRLDACAVLGRIVSTSEPDTESSLRVVLMVSLPKGGKTDVILQKCTEIGVAEFVITSSMRSIPRVPPARTISRLKHWESVIREAAEQSGRVVLPKLCGIVSFDEAVARVASADIGFIAWEKETERTLVSSLPKLASCHEVVYFVGPEGGFTHDEVGAARSHGFIPVSLGCRILRAETAAIVGCALLIYAHQAVAGG